MKTILTVEERDALLDMGLEKLCANEYSIPKPDEDISIYQRMCMINGEQLNGKFRNCLYFKRYDEKDYCLAEVDEE